MPLSSELMLCNCVTAVVFFQHLANSRLQDVVSAVDGPWGVVFCAAAAAAGVLARMIPPHFGRAIVFRILHCPSFAVDEAFRVPLWRWSRLNVTAIIARINVLLLVCFPGRLVCVLPKEVGHL